MGKQRDSSQAPAGPKPVQSAGNVYSSCRLGRTVGIDNEGAV